MPGRAWLLRAGVMGVAIPWPVVRSFDAVTALQTSLNPQSEGQCGTQIGLIALIFPWAKRPCSRKTGL